MTDCSLLYNESYLNCRWKQLSQKDPDAPRLLWRSLRCPSCTEIAKRLRWSIDELFKHIRRGICIAYQILTQHEYARVKRLESFALDCSLLSSTLTDPLMTSQREAFIHHFLHTRWEAEPCCESELWDHPQPQVGQQNTHRPRLN